MKNFKKRIISTLILTLCTQSYCYANDAINIMNAVMQTLSTNPPKTKPKPVYTHPSSTRENGTLTSTTTAQPTAEDVFEKYKKISLNDVSDLNKSVNSLEVTSMLSSQHDGVVTSFDVIDENLKGRIELPWYNNYIVWNSEMGNDGLYFSQEFDRSKNDKAFVVIIEPDKEYHYYTVLEYMRTKSFDMPLTTALLYYPKVDIAFLYDLNQNLLAYKQGEKVEILNSYIVKNTEFLGQITEIFNKKLR